MTHKMKKIRWSPNEDQQLREYYNNPKLDVIKIGSLMKRAPGGVLSRLERLHIIPHKAAGRGYKIVKKMLKENKEKENKEKEKKEKEKKEKENIVKNQEVNDNNLLNEDNFNEYIAKNINNNLNNNILKQYLLDLLKIHYNVIIEHSDNIKYLLTIIESEFEVIEENIIHMNIISLILKNMEKWENTKIQVKPNENISKRPRSNSV